jgi:hypothetical protein
VVRLLNTENQLGLLLLLCSGLAESAFQILLANAVDYELRRGAMPIGHTSLC